MDKFHCECLLESIRATCEQCRFQSCSAIFMPDHFHLLILPAEIQHDMLTFEDDVRKDFSRRVLIVPETPAQRPFRVREKSGARGHRFWQCGRAYNEVILTPKAAFAKMSCCKRDPELPGMTPQSDVGRWVNIISEVQLAEKWKALCDLANADR